MLVKAKWNVKDDSGWHSAGDVFQTENDLGSAVEVLMPQEKKADEVPKAPEAEAPKTEEARPRARSRKRS